MDTTGAGAEAMGNGLTGEVFGVVDPSCDGGGQNNYRCLPVARNGACRLLFQHQERAMG